jgi:hypothetical protein
VVEVFVGDAVGDDDDADIGRAEFMVDDGALSDQRAKPQITLDERRQGRDGCALAMGAPRVAPTTISLKNAQQKLFMER